MKKVFTKMVRADDTTKIERLFNLFRVSMNDWDRTRVLNYNGAYVVVYTIICTKEIFDAINTTMKCI